MNKECFEISLRRKIVNLTFLTSRVGILFKRSDWLVIEGCAWGRNGEFSGLCLSSVLSDAFLFHARFPVWVKSFIASADYCVLKNLLKNTGPKTFYSI